MLLKFFKILLRSTFLLLNASVLARLGVISVKQLIVLIYKFYENLDFPQQAIDKRDVLHHLGNRCIYIYIYIYNRETEREREPA